MTPLRAILLLATCTVLAALALAAPASADNFVVGNCQKNGECVGVCVDIHTACGNNGDQLLCAGISYEVPFCFPQQHLTVGPRPAACVQGVLNTRDSDPWTCAGVVCVGFGAEWLRCFGQPFPPCINICI